MKNWDKGCYHTDKCVDGSTHIANGMLVVLNCCLIDNCNSSTLIASNRNITIFLVLFALISFFYNY